MLEVGTVNQMVTVTGSARLLVSQTAAVGQLIETKSWSFMQLLVLGPVWAVVRSRRSTKPDKIEYYNDGGSIRSRILCPTLVDSLTASGFSAASLLRTS